MAASCVFSTFHMRGTLLKNPQKVDKFFHRTIRTVTSAKSEVYQAGELLCFFFLLVEFVYLTVQRVGISFNGRFILG